MLGWDSTPMRYRELKAWNAWLDKEMNTPSRTDYYLMQIDMNVKRVLARKPRSILLGHSQLKFVEKRNKAPLSVDQLSQRAAMGWLRIVGGAARGLERESE